MQPPRLIASDVDGTLLGDDLLPSARTRAVVERALAGGVPVVLVTGRPPRWVPRVVEHLPGVRWAVCANGAVRYDVDADRVHALATLDAQALRELAEVCARALPEAWLAVERAGASAFEHVDEQFVCEPDYRHAWASTEHVRAPRERLFDLPAIKLLVRAPERTSDQMLAALAPLLDERVEATFASPHGLLEIAPHGVSKASGLADVAGSLGVSAADVVAFGDMPNDVAMLRWAGHGVAMANAHPAVLAAADEVTGANTEDGVALVLERWF